VTPTPRTDRSWELFPHGLLVFERADQVGPSRLLISRVESCTTPDCSCREVGLRAVAVDVDDNFDATALLTGETLRSKFASADAMDAQLDIDLGSLVPDDHEGRVPFSKDWLTYVQSQIDGELLDLLHERWLHSKGMVSPPETNWEPRAPDELVGWTEAHPADRADLYLDGDDVFVAQELFCVNLPCTCDEAMVTFSPTTGGAPNIGSIRVRITSLEIIERDVTLDKAALLDRLWQAFSIRHRRLSERLSHRKKQMTGLASGRSGSRRARAPVTRAERVGRNEPCPCGSGKKYKRCCGR